MEEGGLEELLFDDDFLSAVDVKSFLSRLTADALTVDAVPIRGVAGHLACRCDALDVSNNICTCLDGVNLDLSRRD